LTKAEGPLCRSLANNEEPRGTIMCHKVRQGGPGVVSGPTFGRTTNQEGPCFGQSTLDHRYSDTSWTSYIWLEPRGIAISMDEGPKGGGTKSQERRGPGQHYAALWQKRHNAEDVSSKAQRVLNMLSLSRHRRGLSLVPDAEIRHSNKTTQTKGRARVVELAQQP
jgi:hypothetical protein